MLVTHFLKTTCRSDCLTNSFVLDTEPPAAFTYNTELIYGLVAIVLLLFVTAMIAGAEVAFFSLTQKDRNDIAQKHPFKNKLITRLMDRPKKLIATLVIAGNFINIAVVILFSVIGEDLFSGISSPVVKFVIDVIFVTFLILFFGEVLPKVYANRNNVRFATMIASPLAILDTLLTPLSVPMRSMTNYMQDKMGAGKSDFSVDKLSQALELTSNEDSSKDEQKILKGIVSFGSTDTKQVMSPRIDIFALSISEPFEIVMQKIVDRGFSRIPVYRDNIDTIEGVLFVKDLIPYIDRNDFDWTTLLREPFFVPENKKLDNLLQDFQNMKNHLAIVVDEYGGTSGLVSLEDIIEEIVGDISDEFDDENINYSRIDEHTYLFEGKIAMKDFYRITDVEETLFEEAKGEAETLAGFILEVLGHFPKKGYKFRFHDWQFTIESTDLKRIRQVKAKYERNTSGAKPDHKLN